MRTAILIAAAGFAGSAFADYTLAENYFDGNFFDHFNFNSFSDPTHGVVNYVDRGTAQSLGFINTDNGKAYMGVDHRAGTVLSGNTGRGAVRLQSKSTYNHMLVVIDVEHLPVGCGLWPSFWSVGDNWPNNGEIDIIEAVHDQGGNAMTLHTGPGCVTKNRANGVLNPEWHTSCVSGGNDNNGCGFAEPDLASWQTANDNGGGTWAMEWTRDSISVWWWNRRNPPPSSVLNGNPHPEQWGPPSANWGSSTCDGSFDAHFRNHNLIFDTTFCGDWAGATWGQTDCPAKTGFGDCKSFVQQRPDAFGNAFWSVKSLKVYTQGNGRRSENATAVAAEKSFGEKASDMFKFWKTT